MGEWLPAQREPSGVGKGSLNKAWKGKAKNPQQHQELLELPLASVPRTFSLFCKFAHLAS